MSLCKIPYYGSLPVPSSEKHKLNDLAEPLAKKTKVVHVQNNNQLNTPEGLVWDSDDWSCSYDSLFVILHHIWSKNPNIWTRRFKQVGNNYLTALANGFLQQSIQSNISLENIRDTVLESNSILITQTCFL
jgi:hypothetical protein